MGHQEVIGQGRVFDHVTSPERGYDRLELRLDVEELPLHGRLRDVELLGQLGRGLVHVDFHLPDADSGAGLVLSDVVLVAAGCGYGGLSVYRC